MEVTRLDNLKPYEAPGHFGMTAFRLQGLGVTDAKAFWCGLSLFLPGGGAERAQSPTEKVYVVLDGEIVVVTDAGEQTLRALDSCRIAPNEPRSIVNRGKTVVRMLVISANAGDRA